nr:hypothetical protein [Tanacetum cinerariifolium]
MSHLTRLANSANFVLVKDMMIKLFEIDNERNFKVVKETYLTCQEFNVSCQERREQMIEVQPFLHVSTVLADSYNLLKVLQDYELEKCRELMKSISETQLKVLKKISFISFTVPKYMKLFIEQQIAKTRRFINVMHEQAHPSTNRLAQLNSMILEMEAMNDPEEFYDALFCLTDDKRVEYNTLMEINDVIAKANEKLTTKKAHLVIMEAKINPI